MAFMALSLLGVSCSCAVLDFTHPTSYIKSPIKMSAAPSTKAQRQSKQGTSLAKNDHCSHIQVLDMRCTLARLHTFLHVSGFDLRGDNNLQTCIIV